MCTRKYFYKCASSQARRLYFLLFSAKNDQAETKKIPKIRQCKNPRSLPTLFPQVELRIFFFTFRSCSFLFSYHTMLLQIATIIVPSCVSTKESTLFLFLVSSLELTAIIILDKITITAQN